MTFAPPLKELAKIEVTPEPAAGQGLSLNEKALVPAPALIGPWHSIGAPGEPAFQGTWVNFDTDRPARFCKDASGFVHLEGLIKSGTINTVAFTLPIGYRPGHVGGSAHFVVDSNGAFGVVTVNVSGDVNPFVGNNTYVSLATIHFRAA